MAGYYIKDIDLLERYKTQKDIDRLIKITLNDYFLTGDKDMFLAGLNLAAKAHAALNKESITGISQKAKISREHFYKMLSPQGNPSFKNIVKVLQVLGYTLKVDRINKKEPAL